LAKDPRHLED
jgi:hypothetical protein